MKKTISIVAALALAASLAACGSATGGGGGTPTYHSIFDTTPASGAPAPQVSQSTYVSIFDTPTPQLDAAPNPTSVAKQLFGNGYFCSIYLTPPATGLVAGKSLVVMNAYTTCLRQPLSFSLTIEIQYMNPTSSSWVTEQPAYHTDALPPIYPAKEPHVDSVFCRGGTTYRILVTLSGVGSDTYPYYFKRPGNAITFSEDQCHS